MRPVTELSQKMRISTAAQREELAGLGIFRTSLVITGAPTQETHPVLGMEKLMRVYKAVAWYNLSRKPGKLFHLTTRIISKPSQNGCGVCEYLLRACASALKISLKKPGADTQQTWFLSRMLTECLSVGSCGEHQQCAWIGNVLWSWQHILANWRWRHTGTLVLKAHQHQACPNSKHMLQWNWTHCICKALLEMNLMMAWAAWRWDAMGREDSFQKSANQAEEGLVISCLHCSRWQKPCCQKGVRISPSVYILLTLGQTLRDTLTCIQLPSVFNSLHYFLTALRCTQLLVAIDELTLNTMKILLEAEEKQGFHTSFLSSCISHFWD